MPPATTRSDIGPSRLSRPARVAEEIKSWLVAENMAPGDRLPSEPELMDRFGMAKGTIREAMRILEAQGLIKTRTGPGGGSFVHEVSEERARALLGNYFFFKHLTIGDIYQIRRALEPELAASLAGNLSDLQLGQLEDITLIYSEPPQTTEQEREQHIASLRFHETLATWADNPMLSFIIGFMARMLSDLTVYRRLYEPRNYDLWHKGRDYHRSLIAALRAGDAKAARETMAAHMEIAQRLMERQEAQMERRFLAP